MNISEFLKSSLLILACIFLARFVLPANFTPILAMAVFMPFLTQNKPLQLILPVSMLFLSDLILGFYGQTMIFVYGTMILIGFLSRLMHKQNLSSLLTSAVASVFIWHIVVNFGVYINGLGTTTLAQTYLLAIPFDLRLMASTIVFSGVFFAGWQMAQKYLPLSRDY